MSDEPTLAHETLMAVPWTHTCLQDKIIHKPTQSKKKHEPTYDLKLQYWLTRQVRWKNIGLQNNVVPWVHMGLWNNGGCFRTPHKLTKQGCAMGPHRYMRQWWLSDWPTQRTRKGCSMSPRGFKSQWQSLQQFCNNTGKLLWLYCLFRHRHPGLVISILFTLVIVVWYFIVIVNIWHAPLQYNRHITTSLNGFKV